VGTPFTFLKEIIKIKIKTDLNKFLIFQKKAMIFITPCPDIVPLSYTDEA